MTAVNIGTRGDTRLEIVSLGYEDKPGGPERVWQSSEIELRLIARHNGHNTVSITATLEDGAPPRWRAEAQLELDPGALQQIARDAQTASRQPPE